ncbi:hypothetical protein [Amycolatopsis magusensis]|uniref:hypothetical protein n=1 Tax=Amycolatopsis magusensis TaxID=882444 RepID=UPI0024A92923|nr:hypothetical protein [Amycolatopsis magusensis]MDI5976914.1 hypothetical protein [Amycolatopsis magusensis]
MRVSRVAGLVAGAWPDRPETTALLEASGAVLAWDVLADGPVPAARVHDPELASDWLWEIYGSATDGILDGAEEVTVPVDGDWRVRAACRIVAQLNWVEAWWPASAVAGVPAVDPVTLHAERAINLSIVEHFLDDLDAVVRALATVPPEVHPELAARIEALSENYGVTRPDVAVPRQADYALAAGGGPGSAGTTVLTGSSTVDWTLVPAGVVDAAAPAEWAVVRRQGTTALDVAVTPGPRPGPRLAARFGETDVGLDEVDDLGRFTGSAPVPPSVLMLPPERRVVTVYAPGFAEPAALAPGAEERQAAILAYARSRIGSTTATLTERTAR